MDKVIYTCITSDRYSLKDFSYKNSKYEYVCFTTLDLKSKKWKIVKIDNDENIDNIRLSRKPKILPHKYFPEAEKTIWLDSKFVIDFDIESFILNENLDNDTIVALKHPKRKCIYDEAKYCIENNIGVKKEIIKQVEKYRECGYPENNGLNAAGILIRKNNDIVNAAMEDWWRELINFSHRDQISFNYILWKNKIDVKHMDFKYACKLFGK